MKLRKFDKCLIAFTLLLLLITAGLYLFKPGENKARSIEAREESEINVRNVKNSVSQERSKDSEISSTKETEMIKESTESSSASEEVDNSKQDEGLSAVKAPGNESPIERIKRLIAPNTAGDINQDYRIRVFKDKQIVAVFTDNGSGEFRQLTHAFPCSTAIPPNETPSGDHAVGKKLEYGYMIDGSWGQYCTEFLQYHYFHGMPSYGSQEEGIRFDEFNNLGNVASHGCIRLQSKDAKWIYDYVKEGSVVEILDSSAAFEMIPDKVDFVKMKEDGPSWDPTNENPNNPYQMNPEILLP